MNQITIGDKHLMQISQEELLQIAVMQGCCPHLNFWNYPEILDFDNIMFSDTVVLYYQSTRKEDGIKSDVIVFYFNTKDLSYHYHRKNKTEHFYGKRLDLDIFKFLIKNGYDVPIY